MTTTISRIFKISVKIVYLCLSVLVVSSCSMKRSITKKYSNSNATLELEQKALLGEGAFWNVDSKELYWVDIEGKKIHIYNPVTKNNTTYIVPSRVGTVVPAAAKKAVVALEDGIYTLDLMSNTVTLLSNVESDKPENRFNDGKCDPNGNLWVGSMHLKQTDPAGSVYKIDSQGVTQTMIENVTISNGIVWSKNSKTMYYIDTPTGQIRAFDFDKKTSSIKNQRVVVTIPETVGYPDGMAIDENDMLWVGLWNGNGIGCFNPMTGELIARVNVPAHNVTSCAFGGDNLDTLYITTSSLDMTDSEKSKFPLAGSIFKVKPGVKGVKSSTFK